MKRIENRGILFMALLLLGVIVAMQGKGILEISKKQTTVSYRIDNYQKELKEEQQKNKDLKEAIIKNLNENEKLIAEISDSKSNEKIKALGEELNRLKFISCLTDVKGKGIKIILNDAPIRESGNENPNLLVIHDSDVSDIVNELKKAGAQAISINGERLIGISEQVCAGPTIRINKNRYPVPYEILAIGDPDELMNSLNDSYAVASMRDYKIIVDIKKSDNIQIPKYHNKLDNLITGLEVIK